MTLSDRNRLNVLLVVPRYQTYGMDRHYVMPIGILAVSSYLKRADVANVFTLNLNHESGAERDVLRDTLVGNDIQMLGIGGLSGEYRDIKRIVSYARDIKPELKIMAGGGIMTADPEAAMEALEEADYGEIGEGEITTVELVRALSDGSVNFENISGLIFRRDGVLVRNAPRAEIMDLDSLPMPDYEGFRYGDYLKDNPDLSDVAKKYSQVSVVGGRSCKFNCTFCFHPSGTRYRQRSLDSIFKEIDYLVSHYEINYIALREELFATDNARVADFSRRVAKYDFDWSIQLRIDNVNEELVSILKGTRCRYLFVGVESAVDEVLKSMRKGITLERIDKALRMLKDAGLTARSGVILGDTVETYEYALRTIDWYLKNREEYHLYVDMIIAFPGSVLYRRACENGVIPDRARFLKDGCPIVNVSRMSKEEFERLLGIVSRINGRVYNYVCYE